MWLGYTATFSCFTVGRTYDRCSFYLCLMSLVPRVYWARNDVLDLFHADTPFELHLHLVSRQSGSPMRRGIRYNLEGPIRFQESGSTPPYRPRPKRVSVEIHHATHSLHGVRKQQSCGAGSEVRRNRRACAETHSNLGHVRSSPNVHGQTNEKRPSGKLA